MKKGLSRYFAGACFAASQPSQFLSFISWVLLIFAFSSKKRTKNLCMIAACVKFAAYAAALYPMLKLDLVSEVNPIGHGSMVMALYGLGDSALLNIRMNNALTTFILLSLTAGTVLSGFAADTMKK